ncbi:MAG: hypothetical protein ACXWQ5_18690 [Ktedonobacterales bacterium]
METLLRQIPRIAFVVSIGAILLLVRVHLLDVVALAIVEVLLLIATLRRGGHMSRR